MDDPSDTGYMKCPNCGSRLEKIGNQWICPECEYHTEKGTPAKGTFR
jgi:predicted amidophosphoribosyltransferase